MSKKQHNYYYSYTSSPSGSSSTEEPSAPSIDEVLDDSRSPPAYDEAININPSTTPPPANKSQLTGYVRDITIPSYNPSSPISSQPSSSSAAAAAVTVGAEVEASAPLIDLDAEDYFDNNDNNNNNSMKRFNNTGDYDGRNNNNSENHQLQQRSTQDPYRGRPPPPNYSVYRAKFETKKSGILSRDHHINHDGEALVQFLQQQNTPPRMKVKFRGYHMETHYKTRNIRDSDGNYHEEREEINKTVEDFNFDVDCSKDVSSDCRGVYVLPDPKTGHIKTVRELCDDYVHEVNQLKELRLTKVIEWDYAQLTRAFTAAIRNHGYHHSVEITYEMENYKITIKTNSTWSKISDHKAIRFLFFITCLWIIAWPILWIFRKKFGHTTLKSEWAMKVAEREWYNEHVLEVLSLVHPRPGFGNVPFIL